MKHLLFLLLLCIALTGCSQTPSELRGLKPVIITVTKNDIPLEGVTVSLVSKQPRTLRGCGGITNVSGVAKIMTSVGSRSAAGASPGEYQVKLFKEVEFSGELQLAADEESLPEEERAALEVKRHAFLTKNTVIPEKLSSTESPIKLTVDNKNTELIVDVTKY